MRDRHIFGERETKELAGSLHRVCPNRQPEQEAMSTIIYETIRATPDEAADVLAEIKTQIPDLKMAIIEDITARSIYETRDGTGNVCSLEVHSYEYRVKAVI